MARTVACLVGMAAVLLSATAAPAGDAYIDDIAAAAAHIEQGDYDRAVQDINAALGRRSGDPLARIALGIVFLHTRQVERASREFTIANNMIKNHPLALYGLALCQLAGGKLDAAKNHLESLRSSQSYDVSAVFAYTAALSGRYPEGPDGSADPVLAQIRAQGEFKRGNYAQAQKILSTLLDSKPGFEEEPGAVVSFDVAHPLSLTARPLSKPYKSPSESEPGLNQVSGIITLRADIARARGITYVVFLVDDRLVGMVNHPPYECAWDTTSLANAPHTVKIRGVGQDGAVISEKSTRVLVHNRQGVEPANGEGAARAELKLWSCLRLKPSRRLAYYTISKCADAQNDRAAARAALEHLVAIDPDYKDARSLLIQHYPPKRKYREIWRVRTNAKLAAITFDDGPNPNTGKLLDVLAEKGVKATFFVVGSMAEANPEMLRRIASQGHQIEGHTYSHRNLRYLPETEIEKELIRTISVVRETTGRFSRFFRVPGGHQDGNLASIAGKYGLSSVFWTVNCSKYEGTKPEQIVRQVTSGAVPGAIILMHNVEDVTLMALPKVIDELSARGYKLVTLSQLLGEGE